LNKRDKEISVGILFLIVALLSISLASGIDGFIDISIVAALATLSLYLFFKRSLYAKISAVIINTALIYKILMPWKYRKAIRELDARQLDHSDHHNSRLIQSFCLVAHDIKTPQNIGSLFRLSDALGIKHLYLTGSSPIPPNNKIRKTSRATENIVAYSYYDDPVEVINKLIQDDYKIISLELTDKSMDISQVALNKQDKVCLILGSENKGVNTELLALSDIAVHIPMLGQNSSMNVAMAAAMASYEITKQLSTC